MTRKDFIRRQLQTWKRKSLAKASNKTTFIDANNERGWEVQRFI